MCNFVFGTMSHAKSSLHWLVIIYTISLSGDFKFVYRERSDSVVECLTRDQKAAGSSITGVTALWSLSKIHLS